MKEEKESIIAAISRNRMWTTGAEVANDMALYRLSRPVSHLPDKERLMLIKKATSTIFNECCEDKEKLMDDLTDVCEKIHELEVSESANFKQISVWH